MAKETGQENGHPVLESDEPEKVVETSSMDFPAVLVMRVPGRNPGEEEVRIAELNGLDPLAVPTVLRLAANIKQQQLGL